MKKRRYKPRPLNKLIDNVFHPHFKKHPIFVVIDGALHAIVDALHGDSIEKIIKKEIKYNMKPFIESVLNAIGYRKNKRIHKKL